MRNRRLKIMRSEGEGGGGGERREGIERQRIGEGGERGGIGRQEMREGGEI